MLDTLPRPFGKFSPNGAHLLLTEHALDTAAVFIQLSRTPSGFPHFSDAQRLRLTALSYLHDVGKCQFGYQSRYWPDADAEAVTGHIWEAAPLVLDAAAQAIPDWWVLLQDIAQWGTDLDGTLRYLVAALSYSETRLTPAGYLAHSPNHLCGLWRNPVSHENLAESIGVFRKTFSGAFGEAAGLPDFDAHRERFRLLVGVADTLASRETLFPLGERRDFPRKDAAVAAREHFLREYPELPPL